MIRGTITQADIDRLRASGRPVKVYPQKRLACVSGWQYFTVLGDIRKNQHGSAK